MPERPENDRGRWFSLGAVAIALLAVTLACASRWHHDLSVDEPFMAHVIAEPELVPRAIADDNVPLAYGLFIAWSRLFGTSATALRSLSIVAFGLACLFAGAAGRWSGDDRTGLMTAVLVACSAIGIQHGATARPYALVVLFAAVALWADARADSDDTVPPAVVRVFVPHLLGLFTHPMFLFVAAASAGARLIVPGARRAVAMGPIAAIAVYAIAWGWMLARTFGLPTTSWMPHPGLRNLISGYTHLWGIVPGALLAILAAAAVVTLRRRRDGVPAAVLRAALVAVGVLVVTFAISQVRPMYLSPRTPVFVLPAAALAMGWVLAASPLRVLAPAAAAIVMIASLRSTVAAVRAGDPTPTRASLAAVARDVRCGDVVVAAGMSYPPVTYYAHEAGLPSCVTIVPFPADVAVHPGWPDMRPGFIDRLRAEAPSAAAAVPSGSRVWLIRSPGGIGLEAGVAIDAELSKRRRVERREPLAGSFFEEVLLFGPA
jgi:hypothetical protein